ncbi:M48 family metalloprotease [Eionea flava]
MPPLLILTTFILISPYSAAIELVPGDKDNNSGQTIYDNTPGGNSNPVALPSIGRLSQAVTAEEQRIGQAWLKQYRRQVATSSDPIVIAYLESLLAMLASHSDIYNQSLSLVVAKNNTLNAFAVPGGVIGIHTGLLSYAKTEQQLASVISHELAHLSQRHYARSVEKQKGQSAAVIAGLLAGIILAATTEGDAGAAAISATQAYAIDQQLSFSRSFEREADRIGMGILARAGMSPHATAEIFEEMDKLTRFSSKPPEFLLTHPLTTNRQIDAINLARQYPKVVIPDNINYQFVRARALLETSESPQQALQRFKDELSGFDTSVEGNRYGLALALAENREFDRAQVIIDELRKKYPDNLILKIADINLLAKSQSFTPAIESIQALIQEHPNYYPLPFFLSELYRQNNNLLSAIDVLSALSERRPEDPSVWYELAEISGLANKLSLLNKARAEYFILHANFDNAEQQLKALEEREPADSDMAIYAKERLQELETIRSRSVL